MASPTQWTWVWVNSGSRWWTGKPGVLQSTGSQSRTWLSNWTDWTQLLFTDHQEIYRILTAWGSAALEMLILRCELFGRNCQVDHWTRIWSSREVCRAVTSAQHSHVSHSQHGAEALLQPHHTHGEAREKWRDLKVPRHDSQIRQQVQSNCINSSYKCSATNQLGERRNVLKTLVCVC